MTNLQMKELFWHEYILLCRHIPSNFIEYLFPGEKEKLKTKTKTQLKLYYSKKVENHELSSSFLKSPRGSSKHPYTRENTICNQFATRYIFLVFCPKPEKG